MKILGSGVGCNERTDAIRGPNSGRAGRGASKRSIGDELPQGRGEFNKPGAAAALRGARKKIGKVRNPRRAGSLERDQPLRPHTIPWSPARKWTVGSISGRKGRRGLEWEATLKAAEEKALKGRKPKKARVRCSPRFGGGWRPPSQSEPPSGVADGLPAGGPEERKERRGPERGTAGWEEEGLVGRPSRAPRRLTGRRQAHTGGSRREGNQTLRTEGAGAWNPRDEPDRVCRSVP
jgi:hypothetical protein